MGEMCFLQEESARTHLLKVLHPPILQSKYRQTSLTCLTQTPCPRGCVISVITPHKYEPCDRSVWLGGAEHQPPVNRPGSGQNKYVLTVTWCAELSLQQQLVKGPSLYCLAQTSLESLSV